MFSSTLTNEQRFLLEKQTKAVNESYSKLLEIDKKVFVPAVMGAVIWFRSNLGLLETSLFTGLEIYFLNFSLQERAQYAENFKKELKPLAALYQSASSLGARVTHEEAYLTALETLAPFIASTSDLLPHGFFDDVSAVSDKYFEILLKAPHQLPSSKIDASQISQSVGQYLFSFFTSKPVSGSLENKVFQHASRGNLISNSLASTKLYLYGYQTIEQLNQVAAGSVWNSLTNMAGQFVPKQS